MASSSMIMLSNVSMERLYLSQPPPWNDIQRLTFSHNQSNDTRSSQLILRTCYDKLLHHMYDINSSSPTTATIHQINEQLELAAEYCQLKTLQNENTVYLHSDFFHLEVTFDPLTHLPISVVSCCSNDEKLLCSAMLTALNEKQYRLFREHLNGYASLFTLTAPNLNNDKRIGYTSYQILQQDIENLATTELYGKLLEGFQPIFEGLPMRIKFHEQLEGNSSLPDHLRIIVVSSTTQHYLPIKSGIHIDEKTSTIQLDSSIKSQTLATGHFALEFDEPQTAFTLLLTFAEEISRVTNINTFLSQAKTSNYLANILPKSKSLHRYQWYISHDQSAISIRQIPFTNLKQFIHILNLIRQQISLTKYLNCYFNEEYDQDQMEEDEEHSEDISLELSFLSSTILSITCAQSYHLSTFILQMSDIYSLPLLINRQQGKEIYLTNERNSLLKLIKNLLKEGKRAESLSPPVEVKVNLPLEESRPSSNNEQIPKLNRRLSCGPPAKPTWRRATTLRRNQPACLNLTSTTTEEKLPEESSLDEDMNVNETLTAEKDELFDDDEAFLQMSPSQPPPIQHQLSFHPPVLPRPLLSFHPSTLSRCTSVSSTQSVSTPPIFGLSPSTPYPGGANNPNGNIFFPLGKQVSVPDYSPVSSPLTLGTFDPLAFLPTNGSTPPANDMNNKNPPKKKRRRSDPSEDFIQPLNNDNRLSMHALKLTTSAGGDSSNIKRGKKPMDKNAQAPQQLARQKSMFKVTDSLTPSLLSQQSVTSPDDASNELKPLKVVIKRVEGGAGNAGNDDSQQQALKQRKKQQQQQQQMANSGAGNLVGAMRKMSGSNVSGVSSSSSLVKTESLDLPQFSTESSPMMGINDGMQQMSRERQRPSSSLSNPSSLLASSTSQPRSAPPQPPIVLKIQRSKVGYSGQDPSSSSTPTTTAPAPAPTPTPSPNQAAVKEALKNRARSLPMGANTGKQSVTSPPILAAKLTSPSTAPITNPLATSSPPVTSLFRIPRKSSSQEVTTKPKTEPAIPNTNSSPILSKTPLTPGPGVRPSMPPTQVGSWQSPPTQSSRFQQHRPRPSWPQPPLPRSRTPVTPPNVSALNSSHATLGNASQQPRSILKKPSSNENPTSDLLFMATSDLPGLNEQRAGMTFPVSSSSLSRNTISPGRYDDNDDDSSPQAQLVIDTSSTTANNALLPYTIVPGSNSSSMMDSYDPNHENNAMLHSSHHQQLGDDTYANLD